MRKILLLFCFISSFLSCIKNKEPKHKLREAGKISVINLKHLKKNIVHVDSIYDNFRYIKLESTPNSIIGKYSKIKFDNDTIFVLESSNSQQCIFAFDLNGKFLFKINAKGKGPGEYQKINDFYIDTRSKHIGVLFNSKILKYSFNGQYIGELNFKDQYVSKIEFSNEDLYLYKSPNCKTKSCYAFSKVNSSTGSVFYEDYPMSKEISQFPYNKGDYLANDSENVFINFLYNDTIYFAAKNHIQPLYLLDFGKSKLPQNIFNKAISKADKFSIMDLYLNKETYTGFGLNRFNISKDYLFLLFNKGMETFNTIYSIKSKKSKIFNGFYFQKNVLLGSGFYRINEKTFCSVLDITEAIRIKKEDESDGILEKSKSFDSRRVDKYDFLKKLKNNDNNILVLFDIKEF